MDNTRYAFAVASVRTAETELLGNSFINQLVETATYTDVCTALSGKGFDPDSDFSREHMRLTWDYLCEIAPNKDALKFLIVRNDFHNLKAILKGILADRDGSKSCLSPSVIPVDKLKAAVISKNFDTLPDFISDTAQSAYELLTSTADGRISDIFIDSNSYNSMQKLAEGNEFSESFSDTLASLANIKIASGATRDSLGEEILTFAFCRSAAIDSETLKRAALRGIEQVSACVENSYFSNLASYINSPALLERECDNIISRLLSDASKTSFGIEPLVAYYFAKKTELANLRLILRAKHANLSVDVIKERLRDIYV